MRWLLILSLATLLGCGSVSESTAPAPSESPPPPATTPRPPLRLQVDATDFVEWGEGGGIDGRWSGTRLYGDGRVQLSEGPTPSAEKRIDAAAAARILQAAVDAGLLDLRDHPPSGADMLGQGIQAELDGHKLSVSKDDMTPDPAWDRVWSVLRLP